MNLDQYNWKDVLNAIPDMISVLDEEHKILWLNDNMLKVLGLSIEDCIGKCCYKLVHGTNEPPTYCPYSKFLADNSCHSVEVFIDKLEREYLVTVSPIKLGGEEIVGAIHIARDITEVKKQQRELLRYGEDKVLLEAREDIIKLLEEGTLVK